MSAWDEVLSLNLSGRRYHTSQTGDSRNGVMGKVEKKGDQISFIDDRGEYLIGCDMNFGFCSVERNGTIKVSVTMIGSLEIYPLGAVMGPV